SAPVSALILIRIDSCTSGFSGRVHVCVCAPPFVSVFGPLMSHSRNVMLASRFVVMVISVASATTAGCATNGSTTTVSTEARSAEATTGCPELGRADTARGTFDPQNESIDAALRVFVTAAGELANAANRADVAAAGACERMGRDLQVPEAN